MSKVKDKIEIIIADDHMMIREGLKQLLELDGTMKVIAEANDGEECLNLLNKKIHPDILLLDINMPKKNGIEVLEYIKQNKIPVKVLILTVHNEVEYLLKAVDIGIDGYLLKDSSYDELKEAIDVIIAGQYKLVETTVPAGYNKADDLVFSVEATYDTTSDNPELKTLVVKDASGKVVSEGTEAIFTATLRTGAVSTDVQNLSGTELPATGGIGTKIFYTVGAIIMIVAAVLLIARKRTAKN